jgi:hypothetical protein
MHKVEGTIEISMSDQSQKHEFVYYIAQYEGEWRFLPRDESIGIS